MFKLNPEDYMAETTASSENKQKALQAALSQIEKQFGKGAIMKL